MIHSEPDRPSQRSFPGTSGRREICGRECLELVHLHQLQQATLARERSETALFGEAKHADQEAQPAAIGEEPIEAKSAQRAIAQGSRPCCSSWARDASTSGP